MKKVLLRSFIALWSVCNVVSTYASGVLGNLTEEQQQAIVTMLTSEPVYNAQLTGVCSSTGGGKVYVTTSESDPRESEYVEGTSNVKKNGLNISMQGMSEFQVPIYAWAKPDAGYHLFGWSWADGGTDLVSINSSDPAEKLTRKYDVAVEEGTIAYTVYATFEPYRLTGYTITGNTTTSARVSNQTVTCTVSRAGFTASDFDLDELTIKDATEGGSWVPGSASIESNTIIIPVTFTSSSDEAGEFSATLQVRTKAGLVLNVPLNARTVEAGVEAILYTKKKDYKDKGTLTAMLDKAAETDIVVLNGNYAANVTLDKNISFDLNGYTMTGKLTSAAEKAVLAYSPYGGSIEGSVNVASGKLTLTGGTINGTVTIEEGATLVQSGATITAASGAAIINRGTLTTTDGIVSGETYAVDAQKGTININGGSFTAQTAVNVASGATAQISKGELTGTAGAGLQSAGSTTTEKLAIITGMPYALNVTAGLTTVKCAKFNEVALICAEAQLTAGHLDLRSGYFKTNTYGLTSLGDKLVWRNTAGAEFRDGYVFFGGTAASAQAAGVSVCHIASVSYAKLEDALAYANNTSENVTIIMDNNYTLPAGHYTLPANATLIVPFKNEQGSEYKIVNRVNMQESAWQKPRVFRTLVFADGVNMDVFGTIEVSGSQYSNGTLYTGATFGDYGHLQMNEGSRIVLQNGSHVRAWGYITGDIASQDGAHNVPMGEIDARRGANVYELFQMGDWGSAAQAGLGLLGGSEIFPLNCYFIQNIEVPVKYHPGARLTAATTVCEQVSGVTVMMSADNIQVVGVMGEEAMFLLDDKADAENTWVRKWYDASKDQQVYEVNSGASIGQLVIPLVSSPLFAQLPDMLAGVGGTLGNIGNILNNSGVTIPDAIVMNSGQYNLPITNNFKLHLLSGLMDFTQNTSLLPGTELEIDKQSTVSIAKDPSLNSGSLYIFDWRDWQAWAEGQYGRLVKYAPAFNGEPTTRTIDNPELMGSAKINVHGTFETAAGFVFTSQSGGNIFSSEEDAGTFTFTTPLTGTNGFDPTYTENPENYSVDVSQKSGSATFYPVYLKNEAADDYTHAGAQAEEGDSYCYLDIDGSGAKWTKLKQKGCFVYDAANDVYYIKPQEYVAVVATDYTTTEQEEEGIYDIRGNEESHTFSDAAGEGRLFILIEEECQWWEVENVDNLYHCIHPENDTYYFWDETRQVYDETAFSYVTKPGWVEKKFTITWKDKDWANNPEEDVILATYEVPYGTQAEWLSTNPIRPKNLDYTYNFIGWTPALGRVTQDVTYNATYEENQIKYTVVFLQDGGVEIERHLLARDEVPVCENEPTRTGYILQWDPAIEPVVGNKEYTATWLPVPPDFYTITFKNYDGTEISSSQVEADTEPTPPADPTKPGTTEYDYAFSGWKPAIGPATTNLTYVAQYTATPKTYDVRFFKEDGTTQIGATQSLAYGATPTVPTGVTPASPQEGYSYILEWENIATGDKSVEAVTRAADYKAVFTGVKNKYTVTLKTNDPVGCTLTGAGIYEYGTPITIRANVKSGYSFVKWQETGNTDAEMTGYAVTEDVTLTAVINHVPDYSRPVSNNIGTLCIPYDIPADGIEGAVFYELQGKDENGKLVFDEVTSLQAGHPYIFQAYASEIKLYGSANNVEPVIVNQMTGSYTDFNLSITDDNKHQVVYIANNKFWFCDDLVEKGFLEVVANRCYILDYSAIGSAPNPAPARRRVVLGTNGTNIATDIDNVNGDEVQGTTVRKVLIDNILYIQRGEKMYNVEGQMVR